MTHPRPLRTPSLRRIRLSRALTQTELAHEAGVSRNTIARAELGFPLRVTSLRKIARALDVSPGELTAADDGTRRSLARGVLPVASSTRKVHLIWAALAHK